MDLKTLFLEVFWFQRQLKKEQICQTLSQVGHESLEFPINPFLLKLTGTDHSLNHHNSSKKDGV